MRRGPKTTRPERTAAMVAAYRGGQTLKEIGAVWSLTRERVRQIIKPHLAEASQSGVAIRNSHTAAKWEPIVAQAKALIEGGLSRPAAARSLGLAEAALTHRLPGTGGGIPVIADGKVVYRSLSAASRALGATDDTVAQRLRLGWEARRALTTPIRKPRTLTALGETLTCAEWAARLGCPPTTIRWRLRMGWTEEAACTTPVKKGRTDA